MNLKSLFMSFKRELLEEKTASNLYKNLYTELMNDKKTLDSKKTDDYEYKYLRAVIAVDNNLLTDDVKTALFGKAINDNLILELVPDDDKTIIVLKYVEPRKRMRNK